MIWAATLTAFFGFLRVSEYTAPCTKSYNDNTLLYSDVKITTKGIDICIKASKTDPFRVGATIRLAPNASVLCPVRAVTAYFNQHPRRQGPFFTYRSGRYLTRKDIAQLLRDFLPPNIKHISTHSFRIGAATTAAAAGHPRWLIQSLGRWSSDCFRQYIRIPNETIDSVSRSLICEPRGYSIFDPDNA